MDRHDGDEAIREFREAGLVQRDVLKTLHWLEGDALESTQPTIRIVTLTFALCSIAYINGMDRDKLHDLVTDIIDKFDPDVPISKGGRAQ